MNAQAIRRVRTRRLGYMQNWASPVAVSLACDCMSPQGEAARAGCGAGGSFLDRAMGARSSLADLGNGLVTYS